MSNEEPLDQEQLEQAIALLDLMHSSALRHDKFGSGENLEEKSLKAKFEQYPKPIQIRARSIATKRRAEQLRQRQEQARQRRLERKRKKDQG